MFQTLKFQQFRFEVLLKRDFKTKYRRTVLRLLYHVGLWKDEEAPESPENLSKLFRHTERILHPAKVRPEDDGKAKEKCDSLDMVYANWPRLSFISKEKQ